MSYLDLVSSPILLLDEHKCKRNLKKMVQKTSNLNKKLCPHWKTCQSLEIGKWSKQLNIKQITVSSMKLAQYMCKSQWENIHIAFPFNPRAIKQLNMIAQKHSVSIQIVNVATVEKLIQQLKFKVKFMIQIDAGYGRTGVAKDDYETIDKILKTAQKSQFLQFKGFYVHPGNTYHAKSPQQIKEIVAQAIDILQILKKKYNCICRMGDTPGCSLAENFGEIEEISAGNFVFYDLMQFYLGSCRKEDIAVCLACPITDVNYKKGEILIHGGGVHLAQDHVLMKQSAMKNYGEVVLLNENGWKAEEQNIIGFVKSISQEHGVIKATQSLLERVKVGDIIGILPIHSCMTSACMSGYVGLDGKIIDHAEGKL